MITIFENKRRLLAVLLVLLPACSSAIHVESSPASARTVFAVYGDMPYRIKLPDGETDEQLLLQEIAPGIRKRDDIPFIIHVGDIGRPEFACTDAWLLHTRDFWTTELIKPVFYTPGDNEWADCDRTSVPAPSKELERLDAIRRIFFGQPKNLAAEWRYEQQTAQPENATWWHKGIRFVTQHIVGTGNGREEILLDDMELAIRQADNRDQLNQDWLDHAFEMAKNGDTTALVVATQADVFGAPDGADDAFSRCLKKPAYRNFCLHLQSLAASLDKPVLLIHGDTNAYCLDQPFPTAKTPKLWRLNAPGDYQVIDAALIVVDPANPDKPFTATGLVSGQTVPQTCDYTLH
ncbi:MAG: hypothetical protein PHW13_00120 [Methylococcales bacterium]|nr:hypothetical protein [Methylococcales bacterium]